MFGPRGDPQASNLFAVLGQLQKHGGLRLAVRAAEASPPTFSTRPYGL